MEQTMPNDYAHPDVLVSTEWVDEHRARTDEIRILESNEDVLLYDTGHVPGAVKVDWFNDLQHAVVRDYVEPEAFAELCAVRGIGPDTTVVFYGDKSNWWACYAFWVFKLFGHERCRIMNGGRAKWQAEGRPMTTDAPSCERREYPVPSMDVSIRAFRDDVLAHSRAGRPLIDVRSPQEFSGELLHMPDYPQEGALRGGHIRGAANVPWARAADEDGTFKSRSELERIYLDEAGLAAGDDVVAYCRIGERSSHSWFVLRYLLGFDRVRNYDGSWTEWGNLVGMPIETGATVPQPVAT
jgi:thiosulfate/3-mercaptopyruvate sulfurtransferase